MEISGILILAQADHLTGEEIGFAIDEIMNWGANNVYAFPGITKKNRTGCALLIDIDREKEHEWAHRLAEEFSIYGYHRIVSSHYCSPARIQAIPVRIHRNGTCLEVEIRFKALENGKSQIRAEHSDLVRLREQLRRDLGEDISLSRLRTALESQAMCYHPEDLLEIIL